MLVTLKEVIDLAEKGNFAIPAFNVYNTETIMGVVKAAEEIARALRGIDDEVFQTVEVDVLPGDGGVFLHGREEDILPVISHIMMDVVALARLSDDGCLRGQLLRRSKAGVGLTLLFRR